MRGAGRVDITRRLSAGIPAPLATLLPPGVAPQAVGRSFPAKPPAQIDSSFALENNRYV